MIAARKRVDRRPSVESWRLDWLRAGVEEIAGDGVLAVAATTLDPFHADPADHLIVAAASARGATLVTADPAIPGWPGPLPRLPAGA